MHRTANLAPAGEIKATLISPQRSIWIEELLSNVSPERYKGGSFFVRRYKQDNWRNIVRGLDKIIIAWKYGIPCLIGTLSAKLIRGNGDIIDFGIVSTRVVTTVGVNFLVDAIQGIVEPEILKYHGIGTGNTAENIADTTLVTELTTQYNPDSTRATGSLTEGASANIFRTVGTNSVDASVTIVEHGIFSQAATGGGTLLDRSVFGGISMISGDSLQTTYDLTISAGS